MKLTDYCILFGVMLMGIFVVNDVRINMLFETQMTKLQLNKNMDEIVVDGLTMGLIESEYNVRNIDLNNISDFIFSEMSVLFYGKKGMRSLLEHNIKSMIYVGKDGYYVYSNGNWSDIDLFDEPEHGSVIEEISDVIKEKTGKEVLLSYNDGESYANTIEPNSLIVIYDGIEGVYGSVSYDKCFISAAKIKMQ